MASRKDPIVLSYGDSLLRTSDLKLLDRGNWLNDNLISFWFAYLTDTFTPKNGDQLFGWLSPEIAQLIKSAQYSKEMHHELKTILESGGYLQKSVLFIPLNDCDFTDCGGNHWSLLVYRCGESERCKFEHYDSSNGSNIETAKTVSKILTEIISGGSAFDLIEATCAKQTNSYDCGVHVLANAEALIGRLALGSTKGLDELASLSAVGKKREQIKSTILELSTKDRST